MNNLNKFIESKIFKIYEKKHPEEAKAVKKQINNLNKSK